MNPFKQLTPIYYVLERQRKRLFGIIQETDYFIGSVHTSTRQEAREIIQLEFPEIFESASHYLNLFFDPDNYREYLKHIGVER